VQQQRFATPDSNAESLNPLLHPLAGLACTLMRAFDLYTITVVHVEPSRLHNEK
jgi:hypothetical protein